MASYTGSGNKNVSSSYLFTTLQAFYTKIKTLLEGKADTNHTHNYISGLSISGKTITYTKGDNTTGTITTQDTNTTYAAGTGISLNGTTFSNSGVRAVSTGTANGTISVNTNGTSTNVAVKGLGSAAYTASTDYAVKEHTHNYIPMAGSTDITGVLRTNNEIQSTEMTAFRLVTAAYGTMIRNDGDCTYFLLTNKDDPYGTWNNLRPFTIDNATGIVNFQNGLSGNLNGTASNAETIDGCHASSFQNNINIHQKIDLKSGSFYDCILGKINEGYRGGKIEINNYCPTDTCNNSYWGFIEWTCNENKFAHLVFYSDRWEVFYVREISFGEQTDTGWKRIGDGCNAQSSLYTNSLTSTGFGNSNFTFYQGDGTFDGRSGWCHYLIANHGDGATQYHYTIALPYWDTPIYKRQWEGGNSSWQKFYTTENITYGTWALTPGTSVLATGNIYIQYE